MESSYVRKEGLESLICSRLRKFVEFASTLIEAFSSIGQHLTLYQRISNQKMIGNAFSGLLAWWWQILWQQDIRPVSQQEQVSRPPMSSSDWDLTFTWHSTDIHLNLTWPPVHHLTFPWPWYPYKTLHVWPWAWQLSQMDLIPDPKSQSILSSYTHLTSRWLMKRQVFQNIFIQVING